MPPQNTRRRAAMPHRSDTPRQPRASSNKQATTRKKRAQSKPREVCIYPEAFSPPNPLPLCETLSVTTLHVIRADMDLIGLPEGEKRFVLSLLRKREDLQHIYFRRLQVVKQYINEYDHCQKYRELLQKFIEHSVKANSNMDTKLVSECEVEKLIGSLTRYSYYTVRLISLIFHLRQLLSAPVGLPQLRPVHSIYQSNWYNVLRKSVLYATGVTEKLFWLTRFCGISGSIVDAERQIHEYVKGRTNIPEKGGIKFTHYQDPSADFPLRLLLNAPFSTLSEQQGYTSVAASSLPSPRAHSTVELNTRPIPDLITRWNAFLWSHPSAYQPKERANSLQLRALTGIECLNFISEEERTLSSYVYERRMDKTFANKSIILRTVIIPIDSSAEFRETYLVDGSLASPSS